MTAHIEIKLAPKITSNQSVSLSNITGDERYYGISTVGKDDEAILNPQVRIVSEKIVLKHIDINSYLQNISIATCQNNE